MKTLVVVLSNRPAMCVRDLSPLVAQCMNKDQPLCCDFIRNLKLRISYFIAKNLDFGQVT